MKHWTIAAAVVTLVTFSLAFGATAFAHGTNAHVRGFVTAVSAQSITVEQANKKSITVTVNAKTTFERAGKPAVLGDVKVGDRVVIDMPKNTTSALEVKIGAAPKTSVK